MSEFTLQLFGRFDSKDIQSIVDNRGVHWFTQETVCDALDIERTAIYRIRKNHPGELSEHDDYQRISINGTSHLCFSEEGFFTILDMSTSEIAYRFRKWMRQQFRARQKEGEILVTPKNLQPDDLSDLGSDLVMAQELLNTIAENRRRIQSNTNMINRLGEEKQALEERTRTIEDRLTAWEDDAQIKPGEMTAISLAEHCGWVSSSGAPHNIAVITAGLCHQFHLRGMMERRRDETPVGYGQPVEVWVFTAAGVAEFLAIIDKAYHSGQSFRIEPNDHAKRAGHKNGRNVYKR